MDDAPRDPDWDQLFETAAAQDGLFTTRQAADAGFSSQLLAHHLQTGRVVRIQRGIYRLRHFPAGEVEDLVAVWLWSDRTGVISHQSALALHRLSDVLPARVHVTLPTAWRKRRLRVPDDLRLHYGEVEPGERVWFGPVPATGVQRTLVDCTAAHLSPEVLRDAATTALERGWVTRSQIVPVEAALLPYGGLAR